MIIYFFDTLRLAAEQKLTNAVHQCRLEHLYTIVQKPNLRKAWKVN